MRGGRRAAPGGERPLGWEPSPPCGEVGAKRRVGSTHYGGNPPRHAGRSARSAGWGATTRLGTLPAMRGGRREAPGGEYPLRWEPSPPCGEVGAKRRVGSDDEGLGDQLEVDAEDHIVEAFIDVLDRYPNDPVAEGLERDRLASVPFIIVPFSVNLDDETRRFAHEVGVVGPDRHLPAELVAGYLPASKSRPDLPLGIAHVVAQVSRTLDCRRRHPCTVGHRYPEAN